MVTRVCNQITVYFYKISTGVINSTLKHYVKVSQYFVCDKRSKLSAHCTNNEVFN